MGGFMFNDVNIWTLDRQKTTYDGISYTFAFPFMIKKHVYLYASITIFFLKCFDVFNVGSMYIDLQSLIVPVNNIKRNTKEYD
jgi:hypothetical protein